LQVKKRVCRKKWQTLFFTGTQGKSCTLLCVTTGLLQNLFKLGKKNIIAGLIGNIVDVDIADRAFLVHNEDGPLGEALIAQNAVLPGHAAKGVKIAQQRE
jgi:hypothetical protein